MTEYTTERGITIQVVPIPLLLDKVRQAHPEPAPVTYTEHIAGGETQEVAITPAMAAAWQGRDPEGWKVHADKWAAWQAADDARTAKLNDALWRAVMRRAIILDVPAGEWERDQADFGITVPAERNARREHYIWTEVIGGTRDILRIMGLASGANLTEEQVSEAEASFWDTLQRPAAQPSAAQARAVDPFDAGGAGADG